ncbi:MAG: murein L,D-transpeptidase catalytic domain family protein [Deltaproteobacteria bacterium]|nr:MAG: murein L,D-transpeptidase catalytic domain family protein [Deltaproteobacteria bacterium]
MLALVFVMLGCATVEAEEVTADTLPEDEPTAEASAFPRHFAGDTTEGQRETDRYSCAPRSNQSGPEQEYELTLDEPGLLLARLVSVEDGADVDVHIVSDEGCVDRGDSEASAYLGAGTYRVVADTWVDGGGRERAGAYELDVQFVGVGDYTAHGLSEEVFSRGLRAWHAAYSRGETRRPELTVVDFARSSDKERFWTIDLHTGELVFSLLTTHGEASADPDDFRLATSFSNTPSSHQSSLGLMRIAEDYYGAFGHSLRMDGLEPHNNRVRSRFIVIHPHEWASRRFAKKYGGTAPSFGCLMLDPGVIEEVVTELEGGTLVWNDFAGAEEMRTSAYLQ